MMELGNDKAAVFGGMPIYHCIGDEFMAQDIITFDVGTNFDYRLFDIVKQYDTNHSIKSFYGKLRRDGLPGGRACAIIPEFTMDEFEQYVKTCTENGITFNYLINPLSLDGNVIDPEVGKKIRDFIHTIYDIGVRAITLNSPELVHYVHNNFPDMFITLGLYAYPSKPMHIESWRRWGVNEITLDHSFNRRFGMLRKLMRMYKDTDLHLRIIANNLCLRECPFRLTHGCFVGHTDPDKTTMDYSLINCCYHKVNQPGRFLSSEWVRPDDVHYYRELAEEEGFKNLSLKLVDRTRSTDFIENVVKAYMAEHYDGNLLDILNYPNTRNMGHRDEPAKSPAGGAVNTGRPQLRYAELMKPDILPEFGRTMSFPEIYIDNRAMDGFIEHFINGSNCDENVCSTCVAEGEKLGEGVCGFCEAWAKKAVSYDVEKVEQWKAVASDLIRKIEDGTLYK